LGGMRWRAAGFPCLGAQLCWITVGLLRDVRLWRRAKMDAQIGVGKERL
jgi:hypothetical protein